MYDPMTVAFEIESPFKDKFGNRSTLITIWHVDPCVDGTDDSCGWFIKTRHCDKNILEEMRQEFDFNFKHNYWFDKDGKQIFSTIGTLVEMYDQATWVYFKKNARKQRKFMRKHLVNIIIFAENPVDCIGDKITNRWGCESYNERFGSMAAIICSDIQRKQRKWWQHPKWHVHHWRIQLDFLKRFKTKK